MLSDTTLGAWVVIFVALLACGLRLTMQPRSGFRVRERSAQLEGSERVRLLIEAGRRPLSGRLGS